MSKSIAVAKAIEAQLQADKHWPPNNLNKVMGTDYHYDVNGIIRSLIAIKTILFHGTPPYYFQFASANSAFANQALIQTVGDLTGAIDSVTYPTQPNGWVNP